MKHVNPKQVRQAAAADFEQSLGQLEAVISDTADDQDSGHAEAEVAANEDKDNHGSENLVRPSTVSAPAAPPEDPSVATPESQLADAVNDIEQFMQDKL